MSDKIKSVITCDLDGKIETLSEGAQNVFGYTEDEMIGKGRVSDFSPGQIVLGHVVNWLNESVEKGVWEGDTVFLHKDGHEIPCHIKITPTKGKEGEHIGYCGVTTPLKDKTADDVRPEIKLMTKIFTWLVIMRLPFLTATFVPLLVGAAVANFLGYDVSWGWLGLTVLGGSLLHIGTNTANDYFDHTSGTDEANYNYMVPYSGGSRSIQMGLISAKGMLTVSLVAFLLSAVVGVPLIQKAGMDVLWLGLIGFVSGFFYTAPPFRFASRKGLGELLIGLNFGPLMVAGSALVQTGQILPEALLAGIPIGLLVAAIVYVNEFPDHDGDKATGKDTLIVVFGLEQARLGYVFLVVGAFVSIIVMALNGTLPTLSLIALPAAYLGIRAVQTLYKYYNDRLLLPANAGTINMHLLTGLLFCIGIWLG
ncbi:MAG TPA: 1,4-dihydroxy-2-naphthoate octaprenyltransferase [Candidatus Marinimicrobia bacterium]|jgi:1,4-dihydroxy-2-naphthoate octaprenyltransferase|nr:1,4-dihydroxy-2-naphthoate octaprenyltransferase [Candidatus Neomarinimicrobiota bacterium]|tara:strand:- start:3635 stop:4903 length:1269 start_codon:yes stop_codon:yes gene_type:complete